MKTIDCNIQITEINVGLYFDPLMDIIYFAQFFNLMLIIVSPISNVLYCCLISKLLRDFDISSDSKYDME